MTISLYEDAVLTADLPRHGLLRGDLVRPVEHHFGADGSEGYTVEITNALGETLAVTTLDANLIEPVSANDRLRVRSLAA